MNPYFDWRLVRSFLAALDRGSLLGAARALGVSQPTLGRHIAELEAQLGTVLFERTARGLLPTAMARQLAVSARAMEAGADALKRSVAGAEAMAQGAVRVSASQPIAAHLLPPLLARMRIELPAIRVELVSSNAVSDLLRRDADIALRMVQPEQASLIMRRVGKVGFGAYAHRDYLRRRAAPREPRDLLAHELIGLDRDDSIARGFAGLGLVLQDTNVCLRTDDLNAYWQVVRAGMGIGFVAHYVARSDDAVVQLLPGLKLPSLPLWLVVHREVRSNARIRAVYDYLAQAVPAAL